MMGILSFILVNPLGRKLALAGVVVMTAAVLLWRVYVAGQDHEKTKQMAQSLDAVRKRIEVDEEVAGLSPAERRARLAKWVRG
jgi:hypothetical protein